MSCAGSRGLEQANAISKATQCWKRIQKGTCAMQAGGGYRVAVSELYHSVTIGSVIQVVVKWWASGGQLQLPSA